MFPCIGTNIDSQKTWTGILFTKQINLIEATPNICS